MTFIGTLLDLAEGSRLTGIGLQPLAREILDTDGSVFVHFVRVSAGDDATTAGAAVTAFLSAAVASVTGNEPDGSTWFALFQFGPDGQDPDWSAETADAAVLRSLDLTRVSDEETWSLVLTAPELRDLYANAADVADWSVPDLLVGLLIELTNADLADLVDEASHPALTGEDLRDHRRNRLHEALAGWAATYEGPDA